MDPRSKRKSSVGEGNSRQTASLSSKASQEFEDLKNVKLSTADQVVDWLNQASLATGDSSKLQKLNQVQELVTKKQPDLLDSFSDEVVAFQTDSSADVRKFVVGFMEEACKVDSELFSKFLFNFYMLLIDESASVLKKVIQSSTQLYRIFLQWIMTSRKKSEVLQSTWKTMFDMQSRILGMLDSENDGVRTQSVKFAEKVIITLSEKQRYSELPKKVELCSSLDDFPNNHPILKKSELKMFGKGSLQQLLKFMASPAISSVNLMASMGTLTNTAKQRPQFMATVVQAFETLHANLPPTLAKTQVTSVRKHLKMQLLNLLRHPGSIEFHPQITNLLYDLGTNSAEIARNMPKIVAPSKDKKPAARKRSPVPDAKDGSNDQANSKKPRIEIKDEYDDDDEEEKTAPIAPLSSKNLRNSAIDLTADELVPLLTPENVANLVLLSMVMLPDKIPDAFQASYTPIESAGTMEQIMHLARLLSIQMTAVGIGSGIQMAAEMEAEEEAKRKKELEREEREKEKNKPSAPIKTVIGGTTASEENKHSSKPEKAIATEPVQPVVPSRSLQRRMQGFHLASITKPLNLDVKDNIIKMAVLRVLKAERSAVAGGVHHRWQKILTSLVAQFGGDLHRSLAAFILSDVRNRSQIAFQWLYEEFNIYLENSRGLNDRAALENYDACLTSLLQGLLDKPESKEGLFTKLVLQAPLLTDGAVKIIQQYCEDPRKAHAGISLLQDLVSRRPNKQLQFLRVLLDLCAFSNEKVRKQAITVSKKFYENRKFDELIEQYAVTNLSFLKLPEPPSKFFAAESTVEKTWTEDLMKRCILLFLCLLPLNHKLVHKLAGVYVEATADIKRVILRALETPVNGMGMESAELLHLVETCPKGAETLVTRMLHILTDRETVYAEHPSADLVCRVRDLYQKRVPDVRFLIPVLNGLEQHEVLLSLPKLVRLNPPVVKGVFNRLLGVQRHEDSQPSVSALSPVELLVALHNIDQNKADVKCIIKATSLCFAEKAIYTSEVLVTVINMLVEQEEMPTLLMRTVIQALITYPRLSGFVMNVLQRLIMKRVWEQSKVWEGFVKCCQRMKPQSFQVLLQLPPAQLTSVFEILPDLREPLLQHVNKFTPQQRQHISPVILSVLESTPEQRQAELSAVAAHRALEEAKAREREEQAKVAAEWERLQSIQRNKEAAEVARLEMERANAEKVQAMERRLEEQKERAKALVNFQQRNIKDEPSNDDDVTHAFPSAAPVQPTTSVANSESQIAPADESTQVTSTPFPVSTSQPLSAPSSIVDVKPVVINSTIAALAPAPGTTESLSMPPLHPSLMTRPPPLRLPTQVPPPALFAPPGMPPPNLLFPPPGVNLNLPPHLLQGPPTVQVKTEQRSGTPTQDEMPEESN